MIGKLLATIAVVSVAVGMCVGQEARAGDQTGNLVELRVRDSDGLIYFWMSGTQTGRPACATISYWMIANENSETGKRQFAMLMLAKAQGLTIEVTGKNTCSRWPDGEDVDSIILLP